MSKKKTTEDFIREAKAVHGDKYDYSKVNYVNRRTKVTIVCKKCGNVFDQLPHNHLESRGCPNRCYSRKWNEETCSAVSKLCNGRKDFEKKYPRAYDYAKANKLLDSFSWLDSISLKERLKETKHLIYCVSFHYEDNKYAYVGLTNDWKRRRGEHAVEGAIFNICKKLGLDIMEVLETCTEILEVNLTPRDAQILEDYWKNIRDDEGYIILNKGKTGECIGSLGRIGRKYTLEEAKNVLKMALQKNPNLSRYDFRKLDKTAYCMLLSADRNNVGGVSNRLPETRYKHRGEPVIQLDINGNYIKTWKNAVVIEKALGLAISSTYSCCNGKRKTAGGFKWMYKADYNELVKDKI